MVLTRVLLGGFFVLAACGPEELPPPSLRFDDDPASAHFGTVLATGGSEDSTLSVRVEGADPDAPSVAGTCTVEDEGARFRPRLPFVAGLSYRARFGEAELVFTIPSPDPMDPPVVSAIYPSVPEVPENLLRLYLVFSRPMRGKDVPRYIRLYDADGAEVPLPFVPIESGLWDGEGRRLTLLFHPGRIKRGVGPNLAMGPPLRAGATFRLAVEPGMMDARGVPIEERFEREIRVGPADRKSPDPELWVVTPPETPHSPLEVAFDEPLDSALLLRWIRVESEEGREVGGRTTLGAGERSIGFTPDEPWTPGTYRLSIHPEIEDLAGNTPTRLFDFEAGATGTAPGAIERVFRCCDRARRSGS